MKFTTLVLLSASALAITACGGGAADTESSTDTYTGPYVWNEIDKRGGGRDWKCYNKTNGKPVINSICENIHNLEKVDYYPG